MDLHPALAAEVAARRALPKLYEIDTARLRGGIEAFAAAMRVDRPAIDQIEDGEAGPSRVPVRVYRNGGAEPRPVILFFHGGGFIHSSVRTHDWLCRHLCRLTGAVIVSVDYRLAPEHPFPAGLEDCLAATLWARTRFAGPAGPAPIALMGDSAGGNLCAATALRLRDEGRGQVRAQAMFYPCLGGHRLGLSSYAANGAHGFDIETYDWMWTQYLGGQAEGSSPLAFPLLATDFSGLPPTLVIPARFDIMADDGAAYVERLRDAGGEGLCRMAMTMNHGFLFRAGIVTEALEAIEAACAWITQRLAAAG